MTTHVVALIVVAVDIIPFSTVTSPIEVDDNFVVAIFSGFEDQSVG